MEDVIDKTKKLILSFEESSLITNLDHYKSLICQNKKLLEQINKFNSSSDDYEKIALKKEIYKKSCYKINQDLAKHDKWELAEATEWENYLVDFACKIFVVK